MIHHSHPEPEPSDGGGSGGAFDMSCRSDRRLVQYGVARGWLEDLPERMARNLKALDYALGLAIEQKNSREIRGCMNTLISIVGQVQAEEMVAAKYERIDSGHATEAQAQYVYEFREATEEDYDL